MVETDRFELSRTLHQRFYRPPPSAISDTSRYFFYMAGGEGYAPSLYVSKTYVLLLYEPPIIIIVYKISAKLPRYKVFKVISYIYTEGLIWKSNIYTNYLLGLPLTMQYQNIFTQ